MSIDLDANATPLSTTACRQVADALSTSRVNSSHDFQAVLHEGMRRALEPSSSSPSNDRDAKALRQELSAGGGTKASIAKTLAILQKRGFLNDHELGGRLERRKLADAAGTHAQSKTPYGKVAQTIPLGMDDGSTYVWDKIHPLAFIWYLSSVCDSSANSWLWLSR